MDHLVWNISPELLSIGPLVVRWYGLFFASAFLFGFFYTERRTARAGVAVNTDALLLYLMVGTLAGARLAHCFFYEPGFFFAHPLEILMVWKGGLASHGGLVGFLLSLWLFTRREGAPFFFLLDVLAVPAAFGGALVRLGNFFNSEIVGLYSEVPWAIVFARVDTLPRHPSQLYESLVCLVTFLLLFTCDRAGASRGRGILSGVFLVVIFSSRILLEPLKTRQAPWVEGFFLSMGQMLSIPMVLAGLILLVLGLRRLSASKPSA